MQDEQTKSPEDLHIHRDNIVSLIKKLSVDAKLILYIVYNTPGELSELLFANHAMSLPKSKILPRYKIYIPDEDAEMVEYIGSTPGISALRFYLHSTEWPTPVIKRTMKELKVFCGKLMEKNT